MPRLFSDIEALFTVCGRYPAARRSEEAASCRPALGSPSPSSSPSARPRRARERRGVPPASRFIFRSRRAPALCRLRAGARRQADYRALGDCGGIGFAPPDRRRTCRALRRLGATAFPVRPRHRGRRDRAVAHACRRPFGRADRVRRGAGRGGLRAGACRFGRGADLARRVARRPAGGVWLRSRRRLGGLPDLSCGCRFPFAADQRCLDRSQVAAALPAFGQGARGARRC